MPRVPPYVVAYDDVEDEMVHPCGYYGSRRMRVVEDLDGPEAEEHLDRFLHDACYEENLHPETRAGAGVAYAAQKSMPRRR